MMSLIKFLLTALILSHPLSLASIQKLLPKASEMSHQWQKKRLVEQGQESHDQKLLENKQDVYRCYGPRGESMGFVSSDKCFQLGGRPGFLDQQFN